ncbi:MAG: glycosyltransferase family 9 protein [Proteobacteria bacterium]|nr:glycosyltransferase family 9 protein [Pseudomonadota bacterium]
MQLLIIRFSSLGDVVLATAVVETIFRNVPGVEIDFAVREEYADLFRGDPRIRNLFVWEKGQGQFDYLRELRREKYDLVLDLHRVTRSYRLYPFLRYFRLIGCDKRSLERRLYVWFGYRRKGRLRPLLDAYLETIEKAGLGREKFLPRLIPAREAQAEVEKLFQAWGAKPGEPVLALSPGAKKEIRCWPPDRFAEVGKKAIAELQARVLVLGAESEAGLVRQVISGIGSDRAHPLLGLSLDRLSALLSRVNLLVANDSGPAHVGRAVGIPVGVIFGPTSPEFFPAYGPGDFIAECELSCRPCSLRGERACSRPTRECLEMIKPEEVYNQVKVCLSPSPSFAKAPKGRPSSPPTRGGEL